MIADLKPYPEYRESGLPWLGRVPRHWDLKRTKSFVANVVDQTTQMESGDLYVALENIESWTGVVRPQKGKNLFTSQVKRFRPGDVLFGKLRPYLAKVTRLQSGGVCVGELFVLRPHDTSLRSDFLEKQLRAKHIIDVVSSSTFGAKMPRADWQFLGNMPLTFPPPDEQAAVVRFLDWANGRLERAIRAKRKVIALLNEQKQAIVHHVVTRGLDPSVPLKPSGILWLGEIPEHWEVRRAKYIYREVDERSVDGSEELLSVSHITGVTPRSQKNITMFKAASYAGHKLCRPGDLVVNTMWAWMGALGVSTHAGIISPAYAVYRPHRPDGIAGAYMDGLLRSRPYVSNIICRSTGLRGSRLRLYPEEFLRLPIIQPPADEQQLIVQAIQGETSDLNNTIGRLEREIELLREYRTRLVTDVVTGKLDVREAAAQLPEEAAPDVADNDTELIDDTESAEEEAAL
jgi:type I restriction enzyme, S subunit